MKKNIVMDICDETRNKTYVATAKLTGNSPQKEFDIAYIDVAFFSNNINRIVQQSTYFTVYDELDNMK